MSPNAAAVDGGRNTPTPTTRRRTHERDGRARHVPADRTSRHCCSVRLLASSTGPLHWMGVPAPSPSDVGHLLSDSVSDFPARFVGHLPHRAAWIARRHGRAAYSAGNALPRGRTAVGPDRDRASATTWLVAGRRSRSSTPVARHAEPTRIRAPASTSRGASGRCCDLARSQLRLQWVGSGSPGDAPERAVGGSDARGVAPRWPGLPARHVLKVRSQSSQWIVSLGLVVRCSSSGSACGHSPFCSRRCARRRSSRHIEAPLPACTACRLRPWR